MQLRAMFGKLIMRYQEIAFQDMPHTPGLDLALNSFMSFFTEKIPHPTRLIRLADKNSDNSSGRVIFHPASTAFSTRNLQEANECDGKPELEPEPEPAAGRCHGLQGSVCEHPEQSDNLTAASWSRKTG